MLAVAEEEGVDPSHLDALVSMREARTRFAEVRQHGGYHGQRDGGGWPRSKSKSSLAILQKKASDRHLCFDCGGVGHWTGDAECHYPGAGAGRPKPKAGPKQARVAEAGAIMNGTRG